jgi:hypothetical protein
MRHLAWERSRFRLRPGSHRLDESATGYSLAGCTPAEPASASPVGFIFNQPTATVNRCRQKDGGFFDRQNEEFSIGIDIKSVPDKIVNLF